jgi:hypothetical protein
MTDAELITDEIVEKAWDVWCNSWQIYGSERLAIEAALIVVQDDIVRPYRNVFMGWKRDAIAYKKALKEIRQFPWANVRDIADRALKGEYHEKEPQE